MDTAETLALRKMLAGVDTYRASDLHLSVGNPPMMRVAGKLVPMPDQPIVTPAFMERVVMTWLDQQDQQRLADKKEVSIAKTFENRKRFRISVYYQQNHLSASLMLVPDILPTLQQLGLPPAAQQLVNTEFGLVLVIGPYGARQSLTVASFVEYLNQTTQKHIVTIEQPVEFLFNDNQCVIDQREVGKDVPSVAEGLDFLLEEDVDVVMVTDLSERAGTQKALQLATAGKTVFAILNANTIVTALTQIVHSFPGEDEGQARGQLATSLAGIINQRVITSITGDKITVAEVMIPSDPIRAVIQRGDIASLSNLLMTTAGDPGIRNLDTALREAVERGQLSRNDAARFASNPTLFR